MKAIADRHIDFTEEEQGFLQDCSGSHAQDVHTAAIYGEYYFVEAMYKLKGFEPMFW